MKRTILLHAALLSAAFTFLNVNVYAMAPDHVKKPSVIEALINATSFLNRQSFNSWKRTHLWKGTADHQSEKLRFGQAVERVETRYSWLWLRKYTVQHQASWAWNPDKGNVNAIQKLDDHYNTQGLGAKSQLEEDLGQEDLFLKSAINNFSEEEQNYPLKHIPFEFISKEEITKSSWNLSGVCAWATGLTALGGLAYWYSKTK